MGSSEMKRGFLSHAAVISLLLLLQQVCPLLGAPVVVQSLTGRKLLQGCDPNSAQPNQCFNAQGSAYTCCGNEGCPSSPADLPYCSGQSVPDGSSASGQPLSSNTPAPSDSSSPSSPTPSSTDSPSPPSNNPTPSSTDSPSPPSNNPTPPSTDSPSPPSNTQAPSPTDSPTSSPTPSPSSTAKVVRSNSGDTSSLSGDVTAGDKHAQGAGFWMAPGTELGFQGGSTTIDRSNYFPNEKDSQNYFRSFTHSGDSSPWRLNIGSSGAAYAFAGEDGVDLVGYQYVGEEYLDRVLQSIAAINDQSPPYIIHQAGGAPDDRKVEMYSPLLAWQNIDHGVQTITWPQKEQGSDGMNPDHRANLLLQQRLRDVGGGLVEITYIWHNFGHRAINFVDMPWSGFNYVARPKYVRSLPGGKWQYEDHTSGWENPMHMFTETDGWMAFTDTEDSNTDNVKAIGIYYAPGAERNWCGQVRFGRGTDPVGEYTQVFEAIHQTVHACAENVASPDTTIIQPHGGSYYFRFYIALSSLSNVIKMRDAIQSTMSRGQMVFSNSDAGRIAVAGFHAATVALSDVSWYAFDKPVPNALPLLLLKRKSTGAVQLSVSPYGMTYDGVLSTDYLGFLGWAVKVTDPSTPPGSLGGAVKKLSEILSSAEFPDPTFYDTSLQFDVWVGV